GSASARRLRLKPATATSHEVRVVPRLAPYTRPMAWPRLSSPALTKPMVAKITALDDCTPVVMSRPDASARLRLRVAPARLVRRPPPAEAVRPSVISRMPSRNRPMPPKRVMIPLVMAVPGARRPARGECLLGGDRVAVSGQAGIDTVVGLEPGRQPLASARLAVHQVHRWATLDGPVPVRQLRLAGMGRKA